MGRMYSDELVSMANEDSRRFGDKLFNALQRKQELERQSRMDGLAEAQTIASLKEIGYDYNPSTRALMQRPDYVSTKDLERQKLENELDEKSFEKTMRDKAFGQVGASSGSQTGGQTFGGGSSFGNYQYNPFTKKFEQPLKDKERARQEIKQEYAAKKPLSDTASSKLSAAQQSLENIAKVREMATPQQFGKMKQGFSRIRLGNRIGITNPESLFGNVANTLTGGLASLPFKTTDEQKQFENNISTLIEGQLRARTGAAAPQAEIDREVSRILSSDDSLNSFLSKLSNAEKFVLGISEGLRPGSTAKFGVPAQPEFGNVQQDQGGVPEWASADPEAYQRGIQAGGTPEQIQAIFKKRKII